jgi:flavin reductase (DIM6/NTAB) family NADH-FMN oxidoreductase RutF
VQPPELSDDAVKAFHRSFVTGVTIVTTALDGEPRGLVVNAFASVSITPPLVLVAINRSAATHDWIYGAGAFCVNILAADQAGLAQRFASPIPDKFDGIGWRYGELGVPVLDGCCGSLEAKVQERAQATTHTVFLGRAVATYANPVPPLVYTDAKFYDGAALDTPLQP